MNSRRNERRERVEAKHRPEVFEPTEDEALVIDRAVNAIKPTPGYREPAHHFDLEQQNRGGALS